jgi:hypothetical protein
MLFRLAWFAAAVVFVLPSAFGQPAVGDAANAREAIKAFKAARVKDEPGEQIAAAIVQLASIQDPAVARTIGEFASHADPGVRLAAAQALGKQSGTEPSRALQEALRKHGEDAAFAKAALASLGAAQAADASQVLAKFAGAEDAEVGRAAVAALSRIAYSRTIDALIRLLEEIDRPLPGGAAAARQERLKALAPEIHKGLQEVSGQKHESLPAWREWWGKARASFGGGSGGADPCAPVPGVKYDRVTANEPTDKPAAQHVDLNVKLRGPLRLLKAGGQLQQISGATDPKAVKLHAMFTDDRVPVITGIYNAGERSGCPMAGFQMSSGEIVECPVAGQEIGGGNMAMVLYADEDSLTLKFTREDNVVRGYTLHVLGLCVEPSLLAAYREADAAGRKSLPAVKGNQPIGRAKGGEIRVGIRDCGSFMPPLSKKDWW